MDIPTTEESEKEATELNSSDQEEGLTTATSGKRRKRGNNINKKNPSTE